MKQGGRAGIVHDPKFRRRWLEGKDRCQGCDCSRRHAERKWGWTGFPFAPHHIIGGAARSDEACNLLATCFGCHRRIHEGDWGRAQALYFKQRSGDWDYERLCQLAGRKWLQVTEPEE